MGGVIKSDIITEIINSEPRLLALNSQIVPNMQIVLRHALSKKHIGGHSSKDFF